LKFLRIGIATEFIVFSWKMLPNRVESIMNN